MWSQVFQSETKIFQIDLFELKMRPFVKVDFDLIVSPSVCKLVGWLVGFCNSVSTFFGSFSAELYFIQFTLV